MERRTERLLRKKREDLMKKVDKRMEAEEMLERSRLEECVWISDDGVSIHIEEMNTEAIERCITLLSKTKHLNLTENWIDLFKGVLLEREYNDKGKEIQSD